MVVLKITYLQHKNNDNTNIKLGLGGDKATLLTIVRQQNAGNVL